MRLHSPISLCLCLAVALAASACSSSGDDGPGDDDGTPVIDAGDVPAIDASLDGFVELIGADFTIQPGTEPYRCAKLTVTEDTYITALKDLSPQGTHHGVLSVGDPDGADGEYDCDAGDNEMQVLFASGVGSDALELPADVALKVAAGQQLKLNLHLYNVSETAVTGHAGTLVKLVPAADAGAYQLAEMFFVGTFLFSVPSNNLPYTASGDCQLSDAGTIFNMWPHMHQLGSHIKFTHEGAMKLDEDYSFLEQRQWPTSFEVGAGDTLGVECTWVNDTGTAVGFGDSSDKEMCFGGFYRYPAVGTPMYCGLGG